jgi:hypothetical protein
MASLIFPAESGVDPAIHLGIAEDAEHSPLGPSASERWLECPGSVLRSVGMPDVSSDYADEGTAAHTLTEWIRNDERPGSQYIGQEIEVDGKMWKVDKEMADAAQAFVDFVEQLAPDADVKLYEAKVTYDPWVPAGFGTSDDIRIVERERTCYVSDFKYGKGVKVFAENNPQGMLYAAGVWHMLSHLYAIDRFVISIGQPRLDHWDTWETSAVDLLRWMADVAQPIGHMALQVGAPIKPGEWCRFCPVKGTCPERTAMVHEGLIEAFDTVEAEPEQLSDAAIGAILDKLPLYQSFLRDIEAEAMRRAQAGKPPIGEAGPYKLVEGRGSRKWTDEAEAERELRRKLKVAEIFPKKIITPAQAEKLVGKKHKALLEFSVRERGKPTLAPATDPRPMYGAQAEDFPEMEVTDSVAQQDAPE